MKIRVMAWLLLTAIPFLSLIVPVVHALPSEILIAQMSAEDYFEKGKARYDLKDYKGAIEGYTQAIRLKPDYSRTYFYRALAHYSLKDYQGAIEDSTQAIRLAPDNSQKALAYSERGQARNSLKDYQGAIDDYTQAIRLDPDIEFYFLRANARLGLKDYQGANLDCQKTEGILLETTTCKTARSKAPLSNNLEKQVSSGDLTSEEALALALGKTRIPSSSYNSGAKTTPYVKININNDLRYEDNYVIGSVTNVGTKTARFVKVNFQIYDDSKTLIDTGFTYTQPTDLAPGQTGFFKGVSLKSGASVRTSSVEWD